MSLEYGLSFNKTLADYLPVYLNGEYIFNIKNFLVNKYEIYLNRLVITFII